MLFISTNYHLFVFSKVVPLEMEDLFIFTKKQDAQDLALLLQPKPYILAAVMNIETENKLIWVVEHNVEDYLNSFEVLEFVHESLSIYSEDFQDEWI